VDIFEDISTSTKKGVFTAKSLDVVFDKHDTSEQVDLAVIQEKLFSVNIVKLLWLYNNNNILEERMQLKEIALFYIMIYLSVYIILFRSQR